MARRRFGEVRRRRIVKPDASNTAIRVQHSYEVGQTVYARWRGECRDPEHHTQEHECYWFEPWYVEKVGPRRVLVSDRGWSGKRQQGYVGRDFLDRTGWGIAYGPWSTFVASIWVELPHWYQVRTLGYVAFREDALRTLGLLPADDGNLARIREAYRVLSRKHHPDHQGDPEEFKRITAAYEKLTTEPSLGDLLKAAVRYAQHGSPAGPPASSQQGR